MKLRAEFAVDITAQDYVDAARHQKTFEEFLQTLQAEYPTAQLQIRERRDRRHDEVGKAACLISIEQARMSR